MGAGPGQPITPNGSPMPRAAVTSLGVYFIVGSVLLVYLLVIIWPTQPPGASSEEGLRLGRSEEPSTRQEEQQRGLRAWAAGVRDEERLLLIVALAGALGAYVHAAQSFVTFVGNRQIVSSWLWWYLLRPFIGIALAEILYLVVRGGFFSMGTETRAVNHFGIAALSGLAGMFSKEATDKLHELFKNIFRTERDVPRKEGLEDSVNKSSRGRRRGTR